MTSTKHHISFGIVVLAAAGVALALALGTAILEMVFGSLDAKKPKK